MTTCVWVRYWVCVVPRVEELSATYPAIPATAIIATIPRTRIVLLIARLDLILLDVNIFIGQVSVLATYMVITIGICIQ